MNDRSTTLSSTHLHNLPVRSRSYWRQRARRPAAGSCTVLSSRRPPRCPARRLPRPRARPLPHQTPGPFSFLPPVGTLLNAAVLGPDRCAASQDAAPYLLQRQVLRRQRLRVPVRARAAPTPSPRGRHLARSSAARAAQDLPAQTQSCCCFAGTSSCRRTSRRRSRRTSCWRRLVRTSRSPVHAR